jgi:hypothetical protein
MKNNKDTRHAIEVSKDEEKKLKPKMRKLSKKLVLIGATVTEADIENQADVVIEKEKEKENKTKLKSKSKSKSKPGKLKTEKKLIIESDEEE